MGAAADDRAGDPARGHRADPDQPDDAWDLPRATWSGPWDTLSDEEKRLFSRMAEVYAGFSEYTDAQVGRIVDYLEESGSSTTPWSSTAPTTAPPARAAPTARSTRTSSSTPGRTRSRTTCPSSTSWARRNLQPLPDRLGGGLLDPVPDVQALQLPGRGLRPAGDLLAGGSRPRARCAASTTTAPTSSRRSSTAAGWRCPRWWTATSRRRSRGVDALPLRRRRAPTTRRPSTTRCWHARHLHKGWKAVAEHGPSDRTRRFDKDRWQLFHTDEDRAEAHDLAEQHPDKLEELKALWLEEAEKLRRPAPQRSRS